jgi:protein TonB
MMQRYRVAFLLSLLVFITLWAVYLHFPEVTAKPKEKKKQIIKIALLSPAVPKKVITKKTITKKTFIKKATPKKVIPKKIIKKKAIQKKAVKVKKVQPKKIIKKRVIKKRKVIKRKIIPKKIIKKRIIQKRVIKKKIIPHPPIAQPIIEPIEQPIIEPIEQPLPIAPPVYVTPKRVTKPKVEIPQIEMPKIETPKMEEPTFKASSEPQPKIKNDQYRKAFLRDVRANIIANKKYPKLAKRRHIEGSVKVRFDITQTGEVTNIRFINGKRVFHKSIRKTLESTFPISIPNEVRAELPINDVSVVLHFNII